MIISKIINDEIAYYCLQAEVAYFHSEDDVRIKIDESSLPKSVIDLVSNDILSDMLSKAIVLDFDGIENVQVNALDDAIVKISDLCDRIKGKRIILTNVKSSIIQQVKSLSLKVSDNSKYLNQNYYDYFLLCDIEHNQLLNCKEVFDVAITDKLKCYIEKERMENHSSSVYLSAYIDIKKFITLDKAFFLYCIYRLARKVWVKWIKGGQGEKSMDKPILICQSLNGSFIASILSSLLDLDLFIIDSIGPINKLYRSLGATIKPGKEYIVVSDVVCLGTEVKITKNIIEYLGGIYKGNVSIVRVKSIRQYNNIESVFNITKDNNEEFGYRIITPLDK